jgi:hypothetical protein
LCACAVQTLCLTLCSKSSSVKLFTTKNLSAIEAKDNNSSVITSSACCFAISACFTWQSCVDDCDDDAYEGLLDDISRALEETPKDGVEVVGKRQTECAP